MYIVLTPTLLMVGIVLEIVKRLFFSLLRNLNRESIFMTPLFLIEVVISGHRN